MQPPFFCAPAARDIKMYSPEWYAKQKYMKEVASMEGASVVDERAHVASLVRSMQVGTAVRVKFRPMGTIREPPGVPRAPKGRPRASQEPPRAGPRARARARARGARATARARARATKASKRAKPAE